MHAPSPRRGDIVTPGRLSGGKPAIGSGPPTVTSPLTKRAKTDEGPTTGATTSSIRPPAARGAQPGAGRGRFAGLPPAWNPPAGDPRVCGAQADNVTSAMRDAVLRRWEVMKLVEFLPTSVMQRMTGLPSRDFLRRSARDIVRFIFARANAVEYTSIRKGRLALSRLVDYMAARDIPWEGEFGDICELDLFSFLIDVHEAAVAKGTDARPGLTAVWGVVEGLSYLRIHFGLRLPTDRVSKVLPRRGHKRGAAAILTGARPLPPEALEDVIRYMCDPDTPPVMDH